VLANLEKAEFNELGEPIAALTERRGDGRTGRQGEGKDSSPPQLGLFANDAGLLLKEISELDLDAMTPLEAMNKLHELKKKAEQGK